VNDWVFELTSLVPPHQTKQVHLQRIEYLSGPELLQEIPKKELEELARFYDGNFTIERLGAIRAHARHGWEVEVHWQGFEDPEEAITWQPIDGLNRDIPVLLAKYINETEQLSGEERAAIKRRLSRKKRG